MTSDDTKTAKINPPGFVWAVSALVCAMLSMWWWQMYPTATFAPVRMSLDPFIDLVLRNQASAFAIAATVLGLVAILIRNRAGLRSHLQLRRDRRLAGLRVRSVPAEVLRFTMRAVLSWAGVIWLVSITSLGIYGRSRPIDPTFLLHFPEPTCNKNAPDLLLFVHGWRGDPQNTWLQFPYLACSDPDLQGTEVLVVNYATFIVDRNLTLDGTADWINLHLKNRKVKRRTIVILAHSIGGLVARDMLLKPTTELATTRILVEFATPHMGAALYAQLLPALGIQGGDIVREVAPSAPGLAKMQDDWHAWTQHPQTQCFWTPGDWLVSRRALFFCAMTTTAFPGLIIGDWSSLRIAMMIDIACPWLM